MICYKSVMHLILTMASEHKIDCGFTNKMDQEIKVKQC
jgi:hypothetical protein